MTCLSPSDDSICARSPLKFGKKYLPHYFTCKSPPFHTELCRLWQRRVMKGKNPADAEGLRHILAARGRRAVISAPRGHAKSTIMSLQNVLHAALYGYKQYIIIISDTESQAAGFLDAIKTELEMNEEIIRDFGPQKGKVWKSSSILLTSGVRIDAAGSGQKLRGRRHGARRPDLIVLDDIENDEDVRSAELRQKLETWFFGAVSKAGDLYTDIVFIGTVLHHDCLLAKLMQNPAYHSRCYRAVESFSASPLWDRWRKIYTDLTCEGRERAAEDFFCKNRQPMLDGAKVLWPQKMPYYHLMCMMVSEGEAAFYREMQNQPTDPGSLLFPREWLKLHNLQGGDFASPQYSLFGYCDPSLGKSASGDYSAIITVAKCAKTGLIYVVDADIKRRHPDAIIADILTKAEYFRQLNSRGYALFGAETNQFQWFLKEQLAKESARCGVYLPLKEVYSHGDKTLRIQTLQPDIRNGYLLFGQGQDELVSQLIQFPHGRHDDGPDALQGAVALCKGDGRLGVISGLVL